MPAKLHPDTSGRVKANVHQSIPWRWWRARSSPGFTPGTDEDTPQSAARGPGVRGQAGSVQQLRQYSLPVEQKLARDEVVLCLFVFYTSYAALLHAIAKRR